MKKYIFKDYEIEIHTIVGVADGKVVIAKYSEGTTSEYSIEVIVGDEKIYGFSSQTCEKNWEQAGKAWSEALSLVDEEDYVLTCYDDSKAADLSVDEYYEVIVSRAIEEAKASLKGEVAGRTASGEIIYRHPQGHSHRPDLDAEAIASIVIPEDATFHRQQVDMGHVIGVDHLVETNDGDEIVYFKRGNRTGESRMVLNRTPKETSKVFVVLCKNNDETDPLFEEWCLVTLFEGEPGLPEPWSRGGDTEEAKAFWATHALVPTDEEWAAIKDNA